MGRDRYFFPTMERMNRNLLMKRKRYVITTEYGVLGYYSYDGNRHVQKSVLAFRFPKRAEKVAKVLERRTGITHFVEERREQFVGEGTRQERRIIGERKDRDISRFHERSENNED